MAFDASKCLSSLSLSSEVYRGQVSLLCKTELNRFIDSFSLAYFALPLFPSVSVCLWSSCHFVLPGVVEGMCVSHVVGLQWIVALVHPPGASAAFTKGRLGVIFAAAVHQRPLR